LLASLTVVIHKQQSLTITCDEFNSRLIWVRKMNRRCMLDCYHNCGTIMIYLNIFTFYHLMKISY